MKLWLDDLRPAPEGWTWAKTALEAIRLIDAGGVDAISLDHDLGDTGIPEMTGYDVALHLAQRAFEGKPVPDLVRVHSANPVGRERIKGVIRRYLPDSWKPDSKG
jgi:hypothetical protein